MMMMMTLKNPQEQHKVRSLCVPRLHLGPSMFDAKTRKSGRGGLNGTCVRLSRLFDEVAGAFSVRSPCARRALLCF